MSPGSLHLEAVSLSLGDRTLLGPITTTCAPGEVVTIMGESGCGKSSLLAWLCGTLSRDFTVSGRATICGQDLARLAPEERRLGILFQDDLLFPHLSVAGNLAFALPQAIVGRSTRMERIARALQDAGLADCWDHDPATLSGGQRARVSMMRVLLSEPRALLLDEPFSKLDLATRGRFREFVLGHLRELRLPTLLVTHDPADATAAGGRIIALAAAEPDGIRRPPDLSHPQHAANGLRSRHQDGKGQSAGPGPRIHPD